MANQADILSELQLRLSPDSRRHRETGVDAYLNRVPLVKCADGLEMSVQASAFHYCGPCNSNGPWDSVEIGFPNRQVDELMQYAEEAGKPTDTVYGWVLLTVVANVIAQAGGFA